MRTLLQVLLAVAALIIVPTIGFLIYLSFADLTVHKAYFEDEISEALGHKVSIDGLFDLQVGRQLLLSVEDVSVSNPEWTENAEYFSADRIHVLIDTWSIIGGVVEVDTLELSGIRLNLQEGDGGRGNWEPNLTEAQTVAVEFDSNDETALLLNHVALDDITVSYRTDGHSAQNATIESFRLDRDDAGRMNVESLGSYTAGALTVPFSISGAVGINAGQLLVTDTSVEAAGSSVSVDGSINLDGTGTLAVTAEGSDLSNLGSTFGARGLPGLPYSLSANLSAGSDTISLEDVQLAIGEGEIAGSISVELDQEKPHVTAKFNSPLLDLRTPESTSDETEAVGDKTTEGEQADGRMYFSDEAFAYSWLDAANIDVDISVASIILADDHLEDLIFTVLLNEGALTVNPLSFRSGGGGLSGYFELRPNQGQHSLSFTASISNLRLGVLAVEGQGPQAIPPLDLEVRLAGTGTTIHEIMSSSNGGISGRQGAGQINLQAAGILFSDLITSVLRTLNPLAETATIANLECGVYEIGITDGVAAIEQFALQTGRLTIVSSGDVDLSTEEIDLTLRTKNA